MSRDQITAYVTGFYVGRQSLRPHQETLLRQTRAAQLDARIIAMENARLLPPYNVVSYLLGMPHRAMTQEEAALRRERDKWLSPFYDVQGGALTPVAGGRAEEYARYGGAYDPNHALQSPTGLDDPAFWAAFLITKGISAGGLGSAMTRQAARNAALGGIGGGLVDVGDQFTSMINGGQSALDFSRVIHSAAVGAFVVPALGSAPGLGLPFMALGMASAAEALEQGMPLTAAYRATVGLFGPTIARRLIGGNRAPVAAPAAQAPNFANPNFIGPLTLEQHYARAVLSNRRWSWLEDIPGGANLTQAQRTAIRQNALAQGLIPNVPYKPGTNFLDFEAAGLVQRVDTLPVNLWTAGDTAQYNWLDARIPGGRPAGTTWHHSEIPGRMELVPFGTHNTTPHIGGRSPGMWADAPR